MESINLPFEIKGAIKFNNQAQFNPLKFLKDISNDLVIYENTRALEIKENLVITNRGNITANNIQVHSLSNNECTWILFHENASRKIICYSFRKCRRC